MRIAFPIIGTLGCLVTAGCTTTTEPPAMEEARGACPVLESDGWAADVSPVPGSDGRFQLTVTGKVTMPTPGYTFAWQAGRLDRSAIPTFELRLQTRAPEGMVVQSLETRDVSYSGPAAGPRYRAVTVTCEGRELARIENVS